MLCSIRGTSRWPAWPQWHEGEGEQLKMSVRCAGGGAQIKWELPGHASLKQCGLATGQLGTEDLS